MGNTVGLVCNHETRYMKENVKNFKRTSIQKYTLEIGGEGIHDVKIERIGGGGFEVSPVKEIISKGSKRYYWYNSV